VNGRPEDKDQAKMVVVKGKEEERGGKRDEYDGWWVWERWYTHQKSSPSPYLSPKTQHGVEKQWENGSGIDCLKPNSSTNSCDVTIPCWSEGMMRCG